MELDIGMGAPVSVATNEPAQELKFCTACANCGTNASKNADTYRCFAPQNFAGYSLVDCRKIYLLDFCGHLRYNNYPFEVCGKEAKWFVPKPKEQYEQYQEPQVSKPAAAKVPTKDALSSLGLDVMSAADAAAARAKAQEILAARKAKQQNGGSQ